MNTIVILLLSSVAAFGKECEKKGLNVAGIGEWKLTCKENDCTFQNERELKKKFAELIASEMESTVSDDTGYLEISTQVKTSSTTDSTTTTGSNDPSTASKATTTAGTSAELNTTPLSQTKATCRPSNKSADVTASSNTSCTQSSFAFTTANQSTDYVRYSETLPFLTNFSICAWLSPTSPGKAVTGSLFSYCAEDAHNCKSLNVIFPTTTLLRTVTNTKEQINRVEWGIKPIKSRSHFCVTASTKKSYVGLFINGEAAMPPANFSDDWNVYIPTGGILIIGHEQDHPPMNHTRPYFGQAHQAFVGKIEDLNLWDRILNETEIQNMNQLNCSCPDNAVVTLSQNTAVVEGGVMSSYGGTCD